MVSILPRVVNVWDNASSLRLHEDEVVPFLSCLFFQVKIDGLEEFERQVKHFLAQAIEKWYPDKCFSEGEVVNGRWLHKHWTSSRPAFNLEHDQMINFLVNKTQCYVDRPHEFAQLLKYVAGDHQNLSLHDGKLEIKAQPRL